MIGGERDNAHDWLGYLGKQLRSESEEKMIYPSSLRLVALAFLTLVSGCTLEEGLKKAVFMDYDQVLNFRAYRFKEPITWGSGGSETGVFGHAQDVNGFWLTYVICNLRNAGPKAEIFEFDVNKFYVEFEGKKFFHKPLDPYTFSSIPNEVPGNPQATALVNTALRVETQVGNDTFTYEPPITQGGNPHRFVIYVTKSLPGTIDLSVVRLPLRYDGIPTC